MSLNLKNVGKVAASEVVQVYVSDKESSLVRPEKELKAFEKVYLEPGQTKSVSVRLGQSAFRFYDPFVHGWIVEPGLFDLYVGSSSADIRLKATVNVK